MSSVFFPDSSIFEFDNWLLEVSIYLLLIETVPGQVLVLNFIPFMFVLELLGLWLLLVDTIAVASLLDTCYLGVIVS